MKVLLVNYMETTFPGGINKVVKEISKNLSKRGHEVTVLQTNSSNLPKEEFYEGFKIIRVSSKFEKHIYGFSPEMYKYLKNHFKDLNPDIVHVHGYHTLFSPEVIYLIKKISSETPIAFSPHLDVSHSTLAGKYLNSLYNYLMSKLMYNYVDYIISDSKFETNNILNNLGLKEHISKISLGVDVIDMEKPFLHNKNKIRLIYSGYLIKRKNVQSILKSLHELVYVLGIKNIVLTLVGKGPEKEKLLNLAKDLKLEDHIVWKSFLPREEFIRLIKNSDIFLLLSHSEAYGITIAESLAFGTPCIVTNRTALSEFLDEPGCFGVDYPPNPKDVADLIMKIYENDVQVGPFSKKIRTWNEVAEDYEIVYNDILRDKKRARNNGA